MVIAGISTLWGPHASSSSSPWGSYCWGSNPFRRWFPWPLVLQSVLAESPFFTFFRTLPGRFVPLDKIQQEWATQGQIRDTRHIHLGTACVPQHAAALGGQARPGPALEQRPVSLGTQPSSRAPQTALGDVEQGQVVTRQGTGQLFTCHSDRSWCLSSTVHKEMDTYPVQSQFITGGRSKANFLGIFSPFYTGRSQSTGCTCPWPSMASLKSRLCLKGAQCQDTHDDRKGNL